MTEISMLRDNLENIPVHELPVGYTMRPYRTGDIQHWLDLHVPLFEDGDIDEELFRRDYGHDETVLSERMFFMQYGDIVMGSISAWFGDEKRDVDLGRIHWVVLQDKYQGRGLSKPLLAFALNKLKQLGHTKAYLTTHADLIPAINLYLQFGFEPEIHGEEDKQIWESVFESLNKPR